jgi:geranylgeranyl reductase family protein
MTPPLPHDVLVVGGGPAGAAASYWLARAGHDVCLIERQTHPGTNTRGHGLTPRAVKAIDDMGLSSRFGSTQRSQGLRAVAHGIAVEIDWPEHPIYPSHGYVVRRRDLDQMVTQHAVDAGAVLHQCTEAVRPILHRGLVVGAEVEEAGRRREVRARYLVIADGSDSPFGRDLGTSRTRSTPQGMVIQSSFQSPRHADAWVEVALDVRDRQGDPRGGFGWVLPLGDGTIEVGVGLSPPFPDARSLDPGELMAEFAATLSTSWDIDPERPIEAPASTRVPASGSVSPKVGPNWLVVGDAAGSINPFHGGGIDAAYETGQMAADLISEALVTGSGLALQRYTGMLDEEYGRPSEVASAFSKISGRPALWTQLTRVGIHSRPLMAWVLRVMTNLLRDDEPAPAEAAHRAVSAIARIVARPSRRLKS